MLLAMDIGLYGLAPPSAEGLHSASRAAAGGQQRLAAAGRWRSVSGGRGESGRAWLWVWL